MRPVGVGIIGSQFVSSIHAEALRAYPHADIRAVASPTPDHAKTFAERFSIPHALTDSARPTSCTARSPSTPPARASTSCARSPCA